MNTAQDDYQPHLEHTILDLDLDFFGFPPLHHQEHEEGRPAESEFKHLADETEVRRFLERNCHLSTRNRILGRQVVEHVDAFFTWKEWIQQGRLTAPFAVVHVDAHSDLGAGIGLTCHYIETELLALPLHKRSSPRFDVNDGITSANYLVAVIANRWISRLTYVYPVDPLPESSENAEFNRMRTLLTQINEDPEPELPRDLPPWCFQDDDRTHIQLAHRRSEDFLKSECAPVHLEPSVPFECTKSTEFEFSGFTHMVLAQSPKYIPESTDHLMSIISEYFIPC